MNIIQLMVFNLRFFENHCKYLGSQRAAFLASKWAIAKNKTIYKTLGEHKSQCKPCGYW
jgi:hypothetical protein